MNQLNTELFIWDYEGGKQILKRVEWIKSICQSQMHEYYAGRVAVNFVLFMVLSDSKLEKDFSHRIVSHMQGYPRLSSIEK